MGIAMRYSEFVSVRVWVRNPYNYIRETIEAGVTDVVWDQGILIKRRIDPYKFMQLYYGSQYKWNCMVISGNTATEFDANHSIKKPLATHYAWSYGDNWDRLVKWMANPFQEINKLIITYAPSAGTGLGKAFYTDLSLLQEDYPECEIHIHGIYSYRVMFGLSFKSVDIEPRHTAGRGEIFLPTGNNIKFEQASQHQKWIALMGMRPVDLKIPRNRCIYNIKSALWAAQNFKNTLNIRTRKGADFVPDPDSPQMRIPLRGAGTPFSLGKKIKVNQGDKFLCNMCSLQMDCRFFREGAVCIVPDSEPVELAQFFKTRDSETIINGLGTLLAAQTRRLSKALDAEEEEGALHPETTRIINTLFDRGVKLAKLVDPTLAAAGATRVNLTQNNAVLSGTPQALMASIVDEFVKRGIPRNAITNDMVMKVFQEPESVRQKAIDVAIVEKVNADDDA